MVSNCCRKVINFSEGSDVKAWSLKNDFVYRIGKNIKLITNLQRKNEPAQSKISEQKVEGTNTIFNLDQDLSKIVVGGSATASKLQLQNNDPVFEGTIEELRIGGQEISLWNFVDGSNVQGDYGR